MSRPTSRRRRIWWAIGTASLVVAGSATALASLRVGAPSANAAESSTRTAPTTPTTPPAFHLVAAVPVAGTSNAPAATVITLRFSAPVAASSPMPTLAPPVAGSWSGAGTATLVFTPSARLTPYAHLAVHIGAGAGGVRGAAGQLLSAPGTDSFTVEGVSTLRLQQLLAELGYLPLAFDPAGIPATTQTAPGLATEPTSPSSVALTAERGSFAWRFARIPAQLAENWQPGTWNEVTRGAVMAFESAHGLGVDGVPGKIVWGALLQAVASRSTTSAPYDYLLVSETDPETLYVWRDGAVIYTSLANTGIAGATTALGTFPVYLRYLSTTMSGTNPNGSHYSDPGVPYVAYFNGSDGVHGFPRASYGFPQSVGCVELPIANAATVYPMDPYGTLVTVATGPLATELAPATGPPAAPTTTAPTTTTSSKG